ncbi:MAG TPA: metallophosphoesterase [Steroidobacteraceae bacterium]|jgi:predicted phosphodiesterase
MKIRVLSDLHLEFRDWTPPAADADVIVLAGDIHVGVRGLEWAREQFPITPVIYVAGNHEFYGGQLKKVSAALRETADGLGVHLLDADELVLGDTRFLGATLWTDFALYGTGQRLLQAMNDAKQGMNDFRLIRHGDTGFFRPEDAREIHLEQVKWLEGKLIEMFDGPTVVITHYLPHRRSIHPKYERDRLNPAFASDLARLVKLPATLWIHGHTHESFDYVASGTRVVCNPRGYLPMEPNPAFDPRCVVEA